MTSGSLSLSSSSLVLLTWVLVESGDLMVNYVCCRVVHLPPGGERPVEVYVVGVPPDGGPAPGGRGPHVPVRVHVGHQVDLGG